MCGCKALTEGRFALGQCCGMYSRYVVSPKFIVLAGIDTFTLIKGGCLDNRSERTFSLYLENNYQSEITRCERNTAAFC